MPAKHPPPPGTLAFLSESGRTVFAICNKCGRSSRLTNMQLQQIAQKVGWRTNVQEAGTRLRCRECRFVGARLTLEQPRIEQRVCPRCLRPFDGKEG